MTYHNQKFEVYDGESVNLRTLARLAGIPYPTIVQRYGRGDRGARLIREPDPRYKREGITLCE